MSEQHRSSTAPIASEPPRFWTGRPNAVWSGSVLTGPTRVEGGALATDGSAEALRQELEALQAGAPALLMHPTQALVAGLSAWASAWCQPDFPWRRALVSTLSQRGAFSAPMLEQTLTDLFSVWTTEAMAALLELELERQVRPLEGNPAERRWTNVSLTVVFLAGNSLGPVVQSLLACLLARSPVVLKAPGGDPWFAWAVVKSVCEALPELGPQVGFACWAGEDPRSDVLLSHADQALVFGRAESIQAIRRRAPAWVRLHERGPRVSVAYVDAAVLSADPQLIQRLAIDIVLYERQGCLSPVVVLFEGSEAEGRGFARRLAQEGLADAAARWPAPKESAAQAAERMQWLGVQSFVGEVFEGGGGAVVLDAAPVLSLPPPGRVVWLKCIAGLAEAGAYLQPIVRALQAAAVEVESSRWGAVVQALGALGITRYTRVGRLQRPPPSWTADGMSVLAPLVRWISLDT